MDKTIIVRCLSPLISGGFAVTGINLFYFTLLPSIKSARVDELLVNGAFRNFAIIFLLAGLGLWGLLNLFIGYLERNGKPRFWDHLRQSIFVYAILFLTVFVFVTERNPEWAGS